MIDKRKEKKNITKIANNKLIKIMENEKRKLNYYLCIK